MLRLKCRFHIKLLSICTLFSQDGHDGGQSNKNGETGHADAVHDDRALVEGRGPPPAAVHVVVAPLSSPSVGRWRQILSTPSACSAESVSGPIPGHVKRIIAVEKEEAEKGRGRGWSDSETCQIPSAVTAFFPFFSAHSKTSSISPQSGESPRPLRTRSQDEWTKERS